MYRYLYEIAGIRILCKLPFELTIRMESKEFLHPLYEGAEISYYDLTFTLVSCNEILEKPKGGVWKANQYFVYTESELYIFRRLAPGKLLFVYTKRSWKENYIKAWYLEGMGSELCYSQNLLELLNLETVLLQFDALLLHSSFIRWNGQAVLFSAPSGTGKSTQAELWQKYEQAEILNGDRSGLRKIEDTWCAFGLPYAGSSQIFKQDKAPIRAIVVLRQAKKNFVRRMKIQESILALYPELSIHHWDSLFVERAMNLLEQILQEVPIYLLECRPDREAVEVLKETFINQ